MALPLGYFILLAVLWFLFYWIVGGAFFALIAVFRLGRLKKGRFSCLFSLFSLLVAFGAAYLGTYWGADSAKECIELAETSLEGFVAFFGCSIIAVMVSFLIGAALVLILGALGMAASSAKPPVAREDESVSKKKKKNDYSALS